MALHGKEFSDNMKKMIVALHKDDVGYKKIPQLQINYPTARIYIFV